jgi:mannosyl-3-phosphoglycerate phosphatase
MEEKTKPIVFTDLDGTFLDEETYSFKQAIEALEQLKKLSVPIVFCSSKTSGEIEYYREKTGIRDPFIIENGGAIFIPKGYFCQQYNFDYSSNGYNIIKLGSGYLELIREFKDIQKKLGIKVKSTSELSPQEITQFTALSLKEARLSKKREYGEPFLVDSLSSEDKQRLFEEINKRGLHYTQGNIFYHLHGNNNKGKAAKRLIEIYRRDYDTVTSVGLGDSPNDLTLLQSVNIPILIRKKDLSYNKEVKEKVNGLFISPDAGPSGWNHMILNWLNGSLKKDK